mgnify:CR=1 FL=1
MRHLSETPWLAVAAASTSDGSAPPDLARIHQPSHHRNNNPRAPPFRPEHARLGPPRIVPAPIRMVEEVFGRARSSANACDRHCRSSAPVFARAHADYAEPSSRYCYPTEPLGGPDRTCQAVDPRRDARLVFTYQPALM